ncbi:hydrogenase [Geothermobacter hydrogeniphilus]|uniref:Hydrogenase n=1 Tax=Geothermobacter hydrogeniphilus TaxID=1969733 RepID=A0A2K2H9Q6_9BACT|nr:NADH-quinone oxidoreductase subunit H [Geothermobacter hydrogeniphilus]PNU20044.1 hydrogenase [Geothermobacter hydrogeniphilus]
MSLLILHSLLLLLLAPLLPGIIAKTKAFFGGRKGAPVLQLYFDLNRLRRKGMVVSPTTSWIFFVGPLLAVAVPLTASLMLPFGGLAAPVRFGGDAILFVYLFGLLRFFTASAALDTGSAFEGMGAAREVSFSCLAEPAVLLVLLLLGRLAGSFSLQQMLAPQQLAVAWPAQGVTLGLALVTLLVVVLAENARIPVDDPNTHLELTMIHEVMVLDHSGPALGLIEYGSALKLWVLGGLVVQLSLPPLLPTDLAATTLLFIAGQLLLALLIGIIESVMARLPLPRVPALLIGSGLLAAFGLILILR